MLEIKDLPKADSFEFLALVNVAALSPYLFICGIYVYHFTARKTHRKLRDASDAPEYKHINDWKTALVRPEGISAVVGYMLIQLALSVTYPATLGWLVPQSIKTLSLDVNWWSLLGHFLVFDSSMWCIHYVQHHWRWLYHNTHAVHHTIHSPTIICALTGYLPDTCLLILVPLHFTIGVVPGANFMTVFIFSVLSLFHLHCIHSEFEHSWDPTFRKLGIVNSFDHHVHHLKPRKNLAHFFVALDKIAGTYEDPETISKLAK